MQLIPFFCDVDALADLPPISFSGRAAGGRRVSRTSGHSLASSNCGTTIVFVLDLRDDDRDMEADGGPLEEAETPFAAALETGAGRCSSFRAAHVPGENDVA